MNSCFWKEFENVYVIIVYLKAIKDYFIELYNKYKFYENGELKKVV